MSLSKLLASAHSAGSVKVSLPALQKAMEVRAAQREEEAATHLVGLVEKFEKSLGNHVQALRDCRENEKRLEKSVHELDRALRYFANEGNPLPFYKASHDLYAAQLFCQRLGVPMPKAEDKIWDVPADWVAPEVK